MNNKFIITGLILVLILNVYTLFNLNKPSNTFGEAVTRYLNIPTTASSTVFSVTTSSVRLLATTTEAYNRVASLVQLGGCSGAGSKLHLNIKSDIPATTLTGPVLNASTTESIPFGVYTNPVSQNSVTGIVSSGTCTVVVTEWLAAR